MLLYINSGVLNENLKNAFTVYQLCSAPYTLKLSLNIMNEGGNMAKLFGFAAICAPIPLLDIDFDSHLVSIMPDSAMQRFLLSLFTTQQYKSLKDRAFCLFYIYYILKF